MAKSLSRRALRIFAVLESYREGSPDILDALLPFFEPILAEYPGSTLDQTEFAARVSDAYHWNFTPDIVEELIPRFEARRWVQKVGGHDSEIYRIVYDNPVALPAPDSGELEITQTLLAIASEFADFVASISPLTMSALDTSKLADILVEWLVSIDAYTEDVLRQQALRTTRVEGRIGLDVVVNEANDLTSEERYLCARFVKHLFDTKSPHILELCKLASIGLITEVVQDFHKPTSRVEKTNLVVYLDGPVAMDLLGVSGKEAAANIRPIISQLQSIGGSVRIFRASVTEMQGALDAVLKRGPHERTGPTAGALRRNEVVEAFVREVARDPTSFLSKLGVSVSERKLNQFPSEHEYFDEALYQDLFAQLSWHHEVPRREHDATIVAQVMRTRVKEFSSEQWRHELGRSPIHYEPFNWRWRAARFLCVALYSVGGVSAFWILGSKLFNVALFIARNQ